MAVDTSQFRNGLKIELDGEPFTIVTFQHVKPGKGGAFVRTKVRNLKTGRVIDRRFRSGEKVDEADIQESRMQYLYRDGENLVFMDSQTFEQLPFSEAQVGEAKEFLKENQEVDVLFWRSKPINIELPPFIEAKITRCEPGIKGDTASNVTKPATIETGAIVQVPLFVKEGERIRVDTRTGEYVERVGLTRAVEAEKPGPPRRALVFSGGGARGAYEAGVVRYLVEELPKSLGHQPRFDILCGTSVGAIHACYLAATAHLGPQRGQKLVEFWTSMRLEEVLPLSLRDLIALPRRVLGLRGIAERMNRGEAPERLYGLLNTEPLEKLVLRGIPWRSIRPNVKQGLVDAVCVAATQIGTGHVVVFIESRDRALPRWTRDPTIVPRPTRLLPIHALASAAIPVLFPAVRVASTYYADGGLRLNTPLTPALRLGADRVLVVALRQNPQQASEAALSEQRVGDYGSPLFLFGKVLNALLLDHIDTDLARMRVMNEIFADGEKVYGPDFLERINEVADRDRGQQFRRIEDVVIRPSADLGRLAGTILRNISATRGRSPLIRLAARNLAGGRHGQESDLLSYLLFDGEFLAPLTELGFSDARSSEEELCRFFTD